MPLLVLAALAARPPEGAAQQLVSPGLVTCESTGKERRECVVPAEAEVRLVRRLGNSPCDSGSGWGRRGATLWVDRGCRAEFSVSMPGRRNVVACGREEGGRQECATGADVEVVFLRQLGGAACVRGRTWGVDATTIWTDGGCRAEFEVLPPSGTGPAEPVRVLCETWDERRVECRVPGAGRVVFVRQLGRTACVRDRTWGLVDGRIWVEGGCRAEFEVRAR